MKLDHSMDSEVILLKESEVHLRKLENETDINRTIYLSENASAEKVLSIALQGYLHIVQGDSPGIKTEIDAATRMIKTPDLFFQNATEVALGNASGHRYAFEFSSSNQKSEFLNGFEKYLEQVIGISTIHTALIRIADELFTNAIYNAPVDAASQFRHANSPRNLEIKLHENERATFTASYNADWIALSCSDPFGSLELTHLLKRIQACYQQGLSLAIRSTGGGAGIGCYSIFEMSSAFYMGVSPAKNTVLCCKLPLRKSSKGSENLPKSLHMIDPNKSQLQGANKMNQETPIVFIKGDINEDSVFSAMGIPATGSTLIDLSGVKGINSCGIREWIRWIKATPQSAQFIFTHCPKVVVDQMNMVDGFLPKGARVQSFCVPYYCETCEKLKSVLFRENQEFIKNKLEAPEKVHCDQCQKNIEMDVNESKYFKFLQVMQG